MGSESHLEDGASVLSLRQRRKQREQGITRCMETENQETERRKAKNGIVAGIIKTGILEYDENVDR